MTRTGFCSSSRSRRPRLSLDRNRTGASARQAPSGTAGLRRSELIVRGREQLKTIAARGAGAATTHPDAEKGTVALRDPAGNQRQPHGDARG
jgi:hypothetical protein